MVAPAQRRPDTLTLARRFAVVVGGAVAAFSAVRWGALGLLAAALGAGLSAINLWALERFAAHAVATVSVEGPQVATTRLTAALGAKSVVLMTSVWVVNRGGWLETVPFALGLMVSVFSLLGAGLASAAREE